MIIRTEKNSHYTTICNDALNDPNLSLKAKGLWAFLMTKPETWNINYRGLKAQLKEGQAAILAALKELEDGKYLVRGNVHAVGNGKFEQAQATLYEKPCVENPRTGNPRTGNSRTKVTTEQVKTEQDFGTKVPKGDKSPVTPVYGKEELNRLLSFWAECTELPIQARVQANRNAGNALLMGKGLPEVQRLIQTAARANVDPYGPNISDLVQLRDKQNALALWEKRNSPAPVVNVGALLYPEKYVR